MPFENFHASHYLLCCPTCLHQPAAGRRSPYTLPNISDYLPFLWAADFGAAAFLTGFTGFLGARGLADGLADPDADEAAGLGGGGGVGEGAGDGAAFLGAVFSWIVWRTCSIVLSN